MLAGNPGRHGSRKRILGRGLGRREPRGRPRLRLSRRSRSAAGDKPRRDRPIVRRIHWLHRGRSLRRDALPADSRAAFLRRFCACCKHRLSWQVRWPSPARRSSSRWPTTPARPARPSPGLPSSSAGWPACSSPGSSSSADSASPSALTPSTIYSSAGCSGMPETLRLVHLSDIHFWQYEFNPLRLFGKRLLGTASLVLGRAHGSGSNGRRNWSTGFPVSAPTTS